MGRHKDTASLPPSWWWPRTLWTEQDYQPSLHRLQNSLPGKSISGRFVRRPSPQERTTKNFRGLTGLEPTYRYIEMVSSTIVSGIRSKLSSVSFGQVWNHDNATTHYRRYTHMNHRRDTQNDRLSTSPDSIFFSKASFKNSSQSSVGGGGPMTASSYSPPPPRLRPCMMACSQDLLLSGIIPRLPVSSIRHHSLYLVFSHTHAPYIRNLVNWEKTCYPSWSIIAIGRISILFHSQVLLNHANR